MIANVIFAIAAVAAFAYCYFANGNNNDGVTVNVFSVYGIQSTVCDAIRIFGNRNKTWWKKSKTTLQNVDDKKNNQPEKKQGKC